MNACKHLKNPDIPGFGDEVRAEAVEVPVCAIRAAYGVHVHARRLDRWRGVRLQVRNGGRERHVAGAADADGWVGHHAVRDGTEAAGGATTRGLRGMAVDAADACEAIEGNIRALGAGVVNTGHGHRGRLRMHKTDAKLCLAERLKLQLKINSRNPKFWEQLLWYEGYVSESQLGKYFGEPHPTRISTAVNDCISRGRTGPVKVPKYNSSTRPAVDHTHHTGTGIFGTSIQEKGKCDIEPF
ncbi:hypothetical protein C8J57DRAFT_1239717 [Mycena rebaudengoi]|nr:hypothetical protein C8J57DRAFT_1239717 [Mycena rebaudengoi]